MKSEVSVAHQRKQRGTSLIEVLVSMFVLAIGMLGMAGLTAASAANNKMAQLRSTSLLLVGDYADKARANISGFDSGLYRKEAVYASSTALVSEVGCNDASVAASSCDSAALAAFDQIQWTNTLKRRLPGGNAFVSTNYQPNGDLRTMDIWLMWSEAETQATFDLSNVYPCPAAASAPSNVKCLYFRVAV